MSPDDMTPQGAGPADAAGADTEPDADDMPGAMNELCVPLSDLAQPDEQDAMEPPAVGDKVQANIEVTVKRIEGDKAYLSLDAINGNKLETPKGPPSDADQFGDLQDMASNMPERY